MNWWEEQEKINYRQTERNAFCRGCDKEIKRKTESVIATFSNRNRGQHIYFCKKCVEKMWFLIYQNDNDKR